MNQPIRSSLVLVAGAGLASAVFTLVAPLKTYVSEFAVGFDFGVALAVYFAFFERHRNPAKIAAFICACTAAFLASEFTAFRLDNIFSHVNASWESKRLDIPMPVFFGAGFVGAFAVLAAGMFLFGPRNIRWASLGRLLLWSLGGGFLGVAAGGADGILTDGTYNEMSLLLLIWQPGAAFLLSFLLSGERKAQAAFSTSAPMDGVPRARGSRSILVVAIVFFTCIFSFLGLQVFRTVQSQRIISRRDEAYKRSVAEAPSSVNLPPVEPLPPGQALIVHEIAGLYPWAPISIPARQSRPVLSPAVNYYVAYTVAPGSVRRIVAVVVTQLPNAEWARYHVKYPPPRVAIDSPQSLTRVKKFGQTIVQNASMRRLNGGGTLCFHWPSDNFAVSVCYETPQVDEEFLKQYLEKYPSSL